MKNFTHWLRNAPIKKKFIPLQFLLILCIILISSFSFFSVTTLNKSSQQIIDENVRHKEQLSAIIRNMYVCRVLGRDILLQEDKIVRQKLYDNYITAFEELDHKMAEYSKLLKGTQLTEFKRIIEEKNIYEESMILSADIWIGGGKYSEALYALQIVTPIANKFFGSIDDFSSEEEHLLKVALEKNDELVFKILISGLIINILIIAFVILVIKFFSKNMSTSLMKLEKAMAKIAETGNMKTEIPNELYSKDEVGLIANVANKMKTMLLEYSFNDALTGGYNTKAYHEELDSLFEDEQHKKNIWCIIADLNNLKIINDVLGHLEGDNAIRTSYHVLNENFKKFGKTYRIGGDEFVSLLSNCSRKHVEEGIASVITQLATLNSTNEEKFSLAFGYEHFNGSTMDEYKEFFKIVDKKMYHNKMESKQSRLHARVVNPLNKENEEAQSK